MKWEPHEEAGDLGNDTQRQRPLPPAESKLEARIHTIISLETAPTSLKYHGTKSTSKQQSVTENSYFKRREWMNEP